MIVGTISQLTGIKEYLDYLCFFAPTCKFKDVSAQIRHLLTLSYFGKQPTLCLNFSLQSKHIHSIKHISSNLDCLFQFIQVFVVVVKALILSELCLYHYALRLDSLIGNWLPLKEVKVSNASKSNKRFYFSWLISSSGDRT